MDLYSGRPLPTKMALLCLSSDEIGTELAKSQLRAFAGKLAILGERSKALWERKFSADARLRRGYGSSECIDSHHGSQRIIVQSLKDCKENR